MWGPYTRHELAKELARGEWSRYRFRDHFWPGIQILGDHEAIIIRGEVLLPETIVMESRRSGDD